MLSRTFCKGLNRLPDFRVDGLGIVLPRQCEKTQLMNFVLRLYNLIQECHAIIQHDLNQEAGRGVKQWLKGTQGLPSRSHHFYLHAQYLKAIPSTTLCRLADFLMGPDGPSGQKSLLAQRDTILSEATHYVQKTIRQTGPFYLMAAPPFECPTFGLPDTSQGRPVIVEANFVGEHLAVKGLLFTGDKGVYHSRNFGELDEMDICSFADYLQKRRR